ncbi:hydroxyphenylacetyl-CoA thioesterase PaaI [Marinobacter sp. M3C]|jgi:acyl-CoA thioesterase|uniref:hydroxyphenylacetyl-CoA thioesterase PaaI n=1 Tax=unclassified Marinobacter TaxID=83889 RepID=UPI00200CB420|nr:MULTISPECIES: hydroxyphenylacetyl-CoA thioesterase PaaI [unclassified Marinobacter]MCL1487400.1 hydroxyphenylacetyl-CoA thioesterase PaaI [Marinobacter sp.]UQG55409.1 hydroxyphenylacetyl-CoA thioesterase PaaI [Marinobacter sp. M4C]UQG59238.1 hydroxyphenylacetyl-CoA thioesterase PaaI [Marinobacter sp. M3C]UQG64213.1 hydroxyphenylacetyl-CoA thioesterase PaaI [Marinobacter sp. M2C]UQG68492.1 hydroxyphenylacetyl-CoA thioesterase PaaI [Marinobacter sp. M1C]
MSNQPNTQTPQQLAQNCADAMYQRDEASRNLGMEITQVSPGKATVTMPVSSIMIQGHGSCHGGYLFTLADSAFAFACNSYNKATVASGCSIDYMLGAREGDLLTASAVEQSRGNRTGVYDITITNQDGHVVALFRGKSYQVRGEVIQSENNQ